MPYRHNPCVTHEVYHVFNRSVAGQTIFSTAKDYQRMYDLCDFYRFASLTNSFSHYNRLHGEAKQTYISQVRESHAPLVTISAFAIMPTHIHLAVRQEQEEGIRMFMSRIQNGYAKYFNIRTKRFGSLFQAMFKAVRFESEDQYIHTIRYIHLNPLTAGIVSTLSDLQRYPWTSLADYMEYRKEGILDTSFVRDHFKTTASFRKFTADQAAYQRSLAFVSCMDESSSVNTGG